MSTSSSCRRKSWRPSRRRWMNGLFQRKGRREATWRVSTTSLALRFRKYPMFVMALPRRALTEGTNVLAIPCRCWLLWKGAASSDSYRKMAFFLSGQRGNAQGVHKVFWALCITAKPNKLGLTDAQPALAMLAYSLMPSTQSSTKVLALHSLSWECKLLSFTVL